MVILSHSSFVIHLQNLLLLAGEESMLQLRQTLIFLFFFPLFISACSSIYFFVFLKDKLLGPCIQQIILHYHSGLYCVVDLSEFGLQTEQEEEEFLVLYKFHLSFLLQQSLQAKGYCYYCEFDRILMNVCTNAADNRL